MRLCDLYFGHDVKLVGLDGKTRRTCRSDGYAWFGRDGRLRVPEFWNWDLRLKGRINNFGVLCQFVPDLSLYYSVIDVDSKDFPLQRVLDEFPTAVTTTNHGWHLHYLSPYPSKIKQLTGKDKELCPVDLRRQSEFGFSNGKEGNYVRLTRFLDSSDDVLVVDYDKVATFIYDLYGIVAEEMGDYNMVENWEKIDMCSSGLSNKELFIAYYLFYQKGDWSSAYPTAFPSGIRLAGVLSEQEAYNVVNALMDISNYKAPEKYVKAFMTGWKNGDSGRPYFGSEYLPSVFEPILKRFNSLNEKQLDDLARYLKDVRLYQILRVIE